LLEVLFDPIGQQTPLRVTGEDHHRVHNTETTQGIRRLQRVVEEPAIVVNARHARHRDELVAQHFFPQGLDGFNLRKKSVPPDVESEAFVLRRPGNAADDVVGFEDDGLHASLGKLIGRGQTGRPGANDHDAVTRRERAHGPRCLLCGAGHYRTLTMASPAPVA